jgi:signal transduction histidine kinase
VHPFLADSRRLELHVLTWTLVGAILALLVRTALDVSWGASLVFALPLGALAAPLSQSAWYLCRAMPLSRTPVLRVVVTACGAAAVTAAVWAAAAYEWWLALVWLGRIRAVAPMPTLTSIVAGLGALAYLLSIAMHYLGQAFQESERAARRVLEAEIAHRDAELRALRAQIDPHFLFNSLHSIGGLVGVDPDKAREMCQLLADFLRDSLTLGASARISLGREVALAEQYLHVEQVRFGRRLALHSSVTDDSARLLVPPLILQPLVENAVRHGIATCVQGGTIEISARRAGDRAVIDIRNPCDIDGGRRGTGFGLNIVRRRLGASFGSDAALTVTPETTSYRVSITLPAEEAST